MHPAAGALWRARWNADAEIQQILAELRGRGGGAGEPVRYSAEAAQRIRGEAMELDAVRAQGYGYERLDQLTMEILLGVR